MAGACVKRIFRGQRPGWGDCDADQESNRERRWQQGEAWKLKTPPSTSDYQMYRAEDLHAMLKKHGDWMPLGSADEHMRAM
jgi:hypothetical protein